MAADFTIADMLAWARTKPADEPYLYTSSGNCALCQFLRETGRAVKPQVGPWLDNVFAGHWSDDFDLERTYPAELEPALRGEDQFCLPDIERWTFGALAKRLEVLCSDTAITQSNWSAIDAYLEDIEQVSA
jgi:hypothetical protein